MSNSTLRKTVCLVAAIAAGCGGGVPEPRSAANGELVVECDKRSDCFESAANTCTEKLVDVVALDDRERAQQVSWTLNKPVYQGTLRFRCETSQAQQISKKSGSGSRHRIACAKQLGNCYERAERVCKAGYDVIGGASHRDGDATSSSKAGAVSFGGIAVAGAETQTSYRERYAGELMVECR